MQYQKIHLSTALVISSEKSLSLEKSMVINTHFPKLLLESQLYYRPQILPVMFLEVAASPCSFLRKRLSNTWVRITTVY